MTDEIRQVIDELNAVVRNDGQLLLVANERERTMTPIYFSEEVHESIRVTGALPYGTGITGRAVDRRTPVIANDAHLDPRGVAYSDPPQEEALLAFPLIHGGRVTGCLDLWRNGKGVQFDESDLDRIRPFADRLAQLL